MAERRPLIEGLKPALPPIDPRVERQFVFGTKPKPEPEPIPLPEKANPNASRLPITTRIRADFFHAIKRASLERQLNGQTPNTLQEILEEALEPWLKTNGYLA